MTARSAAPSTAKEAKSAPNAAARRRYQPPRIVRKRSVTKAALWSGAGVGSNAGSVMFSSG